MIVANESNWATEDLEALLKSVLEQPQFLQKSWIGENTLVLFTTSCAKTKKAEFDDEEDEVPNAAVYDAYPKRYENTVLIKIRSANALKMKPLDRLAHIGDCLQHMSGVNVRAVAKTIWTALSMSWPRPDELQFCEHMNMRSRPKVIRSKDALRREIAALNWRRYALENKYRGHIRKLERSEKALERKLEQMP